MNSAPTLDHAKAALKKYFGYDQFRPLQPDVIRHVLTGQDGVVIMPTGGGKSVCFQIPAIILPGVAIVVSPLIALMKDQVEGLKANGIPAAFINSTLSPGEQNEVIEYAREGRIKLLYVSPEWLLDDDFFRLLPGFKISMFAIDEAHCISAWGHDFRPEYTQLYRIKERFPKIPILALTATADKLTRQDIATQLRLNDPELFLASFNRPNLSLNVLGGQRRYEQIRDYIRSRPNESGIIYCLSRSSTEQLANKLKEDGINAGYYHAGMPRMQRERAQDAFINDRIPIVVATIAFGMGIDKSNVRWVIHYNLPKNLEGYYQEIGRAGRDGLPSDTFLYYSFGDVTQLRRFIEQGGQKEINTAKLNRMQEYADAMICRRKILLSYFGEILPEDCGNCDVCKDPPKRVDGTVLVQKALSAIMRLEESVSSGTLIDVLRGSRKAEIIENGYDRIKTYGAGADIGYPDWQAYLLQMLNMGLFEIAYDEGSALKLTSLGKEVLQGDRRIELVDIKVKATRIAERRKAAKKEAAEKKNVVEDSLFERLRELRKGIADEAGMPPYIVFTDLTLKAMAAEMPTSESKMLGITGVGEYKFKLYGEPFINCILNWVQDQGKPEGANEEEDEEEEAEEKPKAAPVKPAAPAQSEKQARVSRTYGIVPGIPSHLQTLALFKRGLSPEEISIERDLDESVIWEHIVQLMKQSSKFPWKGLLSQNEVDMTAAAIEVAKGYKNIDKLVEITEGQLNGSKIQLAIEVLKSQRRLK
ncbi:MAG: DNA helicase RecQ [Bacteroidia bacterium]|nr:DNA helicase RecQ [Bacteroidia bacterium]